VVEFEGGFCGYENAIILVRYFLNNDAIINSLGADLQFKPKKKNLIILKATNIYFIQIFFKNIYSKNIVKYKKYFRSE